MTENVSRIKKTFNNAISDKTESLFKVLLFACGKAKFSKECFYLKDG